MNSPKTVKTAIGLGANMGDRISALREAVRALEPYIRITAKSAVYETPAQYVTDQPAFLNAVVLGETHLEPFVLLRAVKDLENDLGRQPTFRFGPRAIDIDIIFYGDEIVETPELVLPHLHIEEREFVLRPLADVAPDWRHPKTGLTVREMLENVGGHSPRIDDAL